MDYSTVIYWIFAVLTILVIIFGNKWFDWMVKRKTKKLMAQLNSEEQSLPIRTKNSQKNVIGSNNVFHNSTISQSITKTTNTDNYEQSVSMSHHQSSLYSQPSVSYDDVKESQHHVSSNDSYSSSDSYSGGGGDTGGGGSSGEW